MGSFWVFNMLKLPWLTKPRFEIHEGSAGENGFCMASARVFNSSWSLNTTE